MQEIITWIEDIWSKWSDSRSVECHWVNVDETPFKDIAKLCLHSDKIIVTCFNLKIASILSGLRDKLSINSPWIFYLHGLASFGCWPLYRWNVGQHLTSQDVFVGSCERDLVQVRIVFPDIKTFIVPFSLPLPTKIAPKPKPTVKKFAFIGRISSQKNLHTLITSASLLKENFELHFFGKEDFYGSPLMGFRDEGYLDFLKDTAKKLNISDKVIFHGFRDRMEIEAMMNDEEWIFVAPSIHSDENFGMAAFRCLLNGHRVILSDWGGHADYPKHFTHQVKLLNVYSSEIGPWISINEMAKAMSENFDAFDEFPTPSYYSESCIFQSLDEIFNFREQEITPIATNKILDDLLARREQFLLENKSPDGSRLYQDYRDSLKNSFFYAYAGGEKSKNEKNNDSNVLWVNISNGMISITDPHRGNFSFSEHEIFTNQLGLGYSTNT